VRFAEWTSQLGGSEDEFVEIVAYHLESACALAREIARSPVPPPTLEAAATLERAADKVLRREGWSEAVRYYERALAVLDGTHPERALELRLARARAKAGLGNVRDAFSELSEVAEEARERPDLRASALITLGNIDHRQGRPGDARRRLVEAQSLAAADDRASLRVRAAFGLAAVLGDYEAEPEQAVEKLEGAVALAERAGDMALCIEGHLRLGFHHFNTGRIAEAERELQRCTELAAELGSLRDQARAAFLLGLVRFYVGSIDEAEALNRQARDWLERTSEPYFQLQNFRALSLYALTRTDYREAEWWLQQAIPLGIEEGGRYMIEVYRFLTETLVRQGRLGDAEVLVEFAARSVPGEDLVAEAYVELARGTLWAARRDQAALPVFERAIATLAEHELPIETADARVSYALSLRLLEDVDAAREQLALACDAFERMGAVGACARLTAELEQPASGTGRAGSARLG
jgi:tetratricopeptide (TPR) repeat protein